MILSSCGKTHVGMKRSHNEDCLRVFRDENLYVVADGMGGHASGEVASEMSADTIAAFFRATSLDEDITWPYKYDYAQTYHENRIRVGVEMSNQRIFQSAVYDMKLKGMGTTMVAISFYDNKCSVGHVGDSRVYLIRQGELEQITEDHSLLNDYIKLRPEGMTQEEIDAFPHKNVIVRALGMKDQVEVDVITREVDEGDLLLLCSDGLSGMLTDHEMLMLVNRASRDAGGVLNIDLEEVCDRLIDEANRNGGNDNITVLLVRCEPSDENATAELSSVMGEVQQMDHFTRVQDVQSDERDELRSSARGHELNIETKNPFEPAWAGQNSMSSGQTTSADDHNEESLVKVDEVHAEVSLDASDQSDVNFDTIEQTTTSGSETDGSETDQSETDGSVAESLEAESSEAESSAAESSEAESSEAESSAAESSAAESSEAESSEAISESASATPSDLDSHVDDEPQVSEETERPDEAQYSNLSEIQESHTESVSADSQSTSDVSQRLPSESTAEFHAPPQDILLSSSQGESILISPQLAVTSDSQTQDSSTVDSDPSHVDGLDDLEGPKTIVVRHPLESKSEDSEAYLAHEISHEISIEPLDMLDHLPSESDLGMSTVRMLPPDMETLAQNSKATETQEMTSVDSSASEPTIRANPTPLKNISEIDASKTVEWSVDED
jgi:protein phosphatase